MIRECHMNVNRANESQWTDFEDFEDDFRIDWWERGLCRTSGVYSPLFYFVRFLKYFHQLQNTLEYILSNLSQAHFLPTLSNNSVSWSVSPLLLGAVLNEFLWRRPHCIWFMPFILQKASKSPSWPSQPNSESVHFHKPLDCKLHEVGVICTYNWCPGFSGRSALDLHYNTKSISPLNYKVNICFIECWLSL